MFHMKMQMDMLAHVFVKENLIVVLDFDMSFIIIRFK